MIKQLWRFRSHFFDRKSGAVKHLHVTKPADDWLSEVPSDWSNLSRQGVLDFPLSLAALVDPSTSPTVQVHVSLPSLSSNPRRLWVIDVPGTNVDLSLSPFS